MKVIVAGSRDISDPEVVEMAVLMTLLDITEVVSGGAKGVDRAGEMFARKHGIPCKCFPADWDTFGKSAGYRRNSEMGEYADALVAVWDGQSKGTKHMIDLMKKLEKPVFVYEP